MANSASLQARLKNNTEDNPQFHWEWHCINCLDKIRSYGCRMIFLFDSGHPDEKNATVTQRRHRKQTAGQQRDKWITQIQDIGMLMEELGEIETHAIRKAKQQIQNSHYHLLSLLDSLSIKATSETYMNLKKILGISGYRWVECPGEAEYIGIDMVNQGVADYIASNDSDCIACQCDKYITDFDWMNETFSMVNVTGLLSYMKLSPEQFMIACCCMGNDYVENIWEKGLMWNKVKFMLRTEEIKTRDDMFNKYSDKETVLRFCWDLYTRKDGLGKDELLKRIEGNTRLSPRKVQQIRETGVCV